MAEHKQEHVLTQAELVTISILQAIKVDLLLEKTRLQKNGAVIEEPIVDDEPDKAQFICPDEQSIDFDKLIEEHLHELPYYKQITIDEAIEKSQQILDAVESPAPDESKKKTSHTRIFEWRAKYMAWLATRSAWRVKKSQLDHEYARKKSSAIQLCYGIDYAISVIDREIERQRTGSGIHVVSIEQ